MFNDHNFNEGLFNAGLARLEGASQLAITVSGALGVDLQGVARLTVIGSGILKDEKVLAGGASLAVTGSATLQDFAYVRPYPFNGAAFNYFAFNAPSPKNMAASVACVVTTAAALRKEIDLAGATTGVVTTSCPGVSGTNKLEGSSSTAVTVAAALWHESLFFGATSLSVATSAVLKKEAVLAGAALGVVDSLGTVGDVLRAPSGELFLGAYTPTETVAEFDVDEIFVEVDDGLVVVAVNDGEIYANATY